MSFHTVHSNELLVQTSEILSPAKTKERKSHEKRSGVNICIGNAAMQEGEKIRNERETQLLPRQII